MKKTLIASAVAATLTSHAMAMENDAADLAAKMDAMPTVYGTIELVHVSDDSDSSEDNKFQDNGSTIGIVHEHMISEDITAFAKAEFEFAADDGGESEGINALDEAYIGLKGAFGAVQIGSDETVYDWVDYLDTNENTGIGGGIAATKEGDNIQYMSPEIAEGITLGLTAPINSDSNFGGALAAKYAVDNLEVALAYSMGRDDGATTAEDTIGLGGSFSIDDITLMAQYETQDKYKDVFGLMATYAMGQNSFSLGYQMTSYDDSNAEDGSDIYIQALHNLSDNAYIYLEYLMQSDLTDETTLGSGSKATVLESDIDTLAIGATYSF